MDAHQRLDGLDDALGIADQIAIDVLQRQIVDQPRQQPGQVQDFAVRPAHRREAGIVRQCFGNLRIDAALVLAFMCHDLALDDGVCLGDEGRCSVRLRIVKRVGDGTQPVKAVT